MKNRNYLKNILLVDLEGTITDFSHRLKYLKTNKEKFNNEFKNDEPDKDIIDFINSMYNNNYNINIVIISSRREFFRKDSELWLRKNNVIFDELVMQRDKDKRTQIEYKFDYIKENKNKILLAIEDNEKMCSFLKQNFIPVIKAKR